MKNQFRKKLDTNNCKRMKAPTSYHIQNPDIVFKELNLKLGDIFLDIGCGSGDYSIHASKIVGVSGKVYSLDKPEETIKIFKEKISKLKIHNIETKVSDITKELPLEDSSIDVCLVSTVLHAINFDKYKETVFKEIYRVLKPFGRLITIDCSKKDLSFGPPESMRLDSEEIEKSAKQIGFKKINHIDLGFNYLNQFEK
jgi:ubiquinone/menaquinone biosynthesis C-methylase UbiE